MSRQGKGRLPLSRGGRRSYQEKGENQGPISNRYKETGREVPKKGGGGKAGRALLAGKKEEH